MTLSIKLKIRQRQDTKKNCKYFCHDIWPMLFSGQMPRASNSSHLFWNLEDPKLAQHYCPIEGK